MFTLHISLITLEVAVNVINGSVMSTFVNSSKRGSKIHFMHLWDIRKGAYIIIRINEQAEGKKLSLHNNCNSAGHGVQIPSSGFAWGQIVLRVLHTEKKKLQI